jgi:hypothetical protein
MPDPYISAELRLLVTQRAGNRCEYCGALAAYSSDTFTFDHIKPRSLGGLTTADNLALACFSCNQHKAARMAASDPATGFSAPLFHPRQQNWDEHFTWDDTFTLMQGMTPTGRATIAALHLNRLGLVNLRRLLYQFGEHPQR